MRRIFVKLNIETKTVFNHYMRKCLILFSDRLCIITSHDCVVDIVSHSVSSWKKCHCRDT